MSAANHNTAAAPSRAEQPPRRPAYPVEQPIAFDFGAIWSAIYRARYWIFGIIAATILCGAIALMLATPIYAASASVQIDQGPVKIVGTEEADASAAIQDADRFLQTQIDIVKSRSLAENVAKDLHLLTSDNFLNSMGMTPDYDGLSASERRKKREEAVVGALTAHLSTNLPLDSRIVTITFESPDAELSARIANSYANNFVLNNLQRRRDTLNYARRFLASQLAEARNRLAQSEMDATRYSEKARIIGIANDEQQVGSGAQTLTGQSLQQLNSDLNTAVARRIAAARQWAAIADLPALSIPQVNQNEAVQRLSEQLSSKRAALAAERARHLPDHPGVRQLQSEISTLSDQLALHARNIRQGLRAPYDSALGTERELRDRLTSLKKEQLREQRAAIQLGILERQNQTNRTQYEALLARYTELTAQSGVQTNNLSLVDRARVPDHPVKPNGSLVLTLAGMIGLGCATLFTFFREHVFGRLRTPDDIERGLRLSLYGVTPDVSDQSACDALLDPGSELSEAYAAIRASLNISSVGGLPRSLAFTSATEGEGKSLSCFALASAYARLGKKVLVIDADLRKPCQHILFGMDNDVGLSAVLSRTASLADIVRHDARRQIDVIPSGACPPNPAELLAADNLASVTARLSEQYDGIFIDCPPILGFADAIELASVSEQTVLVVRSGANSVHSARQAFRRLSDIQGRIGGVILSRFDARKSGYGAQYGQNLKYG